MGRGWVPRQKTLFSFSLIFEIIFYIKILNLALKLNVKLQKIL